jgi:membrane carboxypeptidase/penicillin-binding protein PbpC
MLAATHRRHGSEAATSAIAHAPEGLVPREVCALSGMPSNRWCPSRRREWLLPADAGDEANCSWHHQSDEGVLTFWPAEYRQWARENGLVTAGRSDVRIGSSEDRGVGSSESRSDSVVRTSGSSVVRDSGRGLEIVNPPAGGIYLVDPTLRREFQTLPLRAMTKRPGLIEWLVDGRVVGTSSSDSAFQWPLAVGEHKIVARDTVGNIAESSVIVK